MVKKITRDYRFIIVRLAKKGRTLYFPYSDKGFGEAYFDEERLRKGCFYFKFEGLSIKLVGKVEELVRNVKYNGVFFEDKKRLEVAVQQNL